MKTGRLFLIPSALSDEFPASYSPQATTDIVHALRDFIAERAKTARAYLKSVGHPFPIQELNVIEIDKHGPNDYEAMLAPCFEGRDMGFLSEAGAPGVADPGADAVKVAHNFGIQVVPLVGPSSLLLALMASGLNGQRFAFHGYLDRDERTLSNELKALESESNRRDMTQMFIETPYRNMKMLEVMCKTLRNETRLCVASSITSKDEFILTQSIADWKKMKVNIDRKPTVFLIYAKT